MVSKEDGLRPYDPSELTPEKRAERRQERLWRQESIGAGMGMSTEPGRRTYRVDWPKKVSEEQAKRWLISMADKLLADAPPEDREAIARLLASLREDTETDAQ